MLKAMHLIYAMLALICVFAAASLAGPSPAAGEPLTAVIVGCSADRPDPSCEAAPAAVVADAQMRDPRLRPRSTEATLRIGG